MSSSLTQAAPTDSVPLFITQLDSLGGSERSLLALAFWLHREGRKVHFVTYENNFDFARFATFPLLIEELRPANNARAKVAAVKAYFAERAFHFAPLVSGYQPALHATLAGIGPFHCLMHDTPTLFSSGGRGSAKERVRIAVSDALIGYGMWSGAGRMIVTSEFLQRDCLTRFAIDADIARMGGMGDAGGFRPRPIERELRMLSVCRIEANKRVDWMLNALAGMERARVPLSAKVDWRLDLAGKGALLETMRARANELGLGERVCFHGFVSDEDLAGLYDRAHLFLMPAVQGYGIPAVEALGRGIPVLLHRESGVSDVLQETPWAAVMTGGEAELERTLGAFLETLMRGEHLHAAAPELPSEDAWAERVARLCGY